MVFHCRHNQRNIFRASMYNDIYLQINIWGFLWLFTVDPFKEIYEMSVCIKAYIYRKIFLDFYVDPFKEMCEVSVCIKPVFTNKYSGIFVVIHWSPIQRNM